MKPHVHPPHPLAAACSHSLRLLTMLTAVTLISLVMSSCGKKPASTENAAANKSTEPVTLTIYTWGDYFDPETLNRFTEQTGIKINYEAFENTAQMISAVRSTPDKYDIIITDDSVIANMRDLSLLGELNLDKIPNHKNVDSKFRGLEFDPENKISLPYLWGTTLISYNKAVLGDVKPSWDILLDERCKGKVYVTDEAYDILGVVLLKLGHDLNTQKAEDIEEARQVLHKLFINQDAKMASYEGIREAMTAGEGLVAVNYSGDAAIDATNVEGLDFYVPEEGAPLWVDNFAITRDSKYRDSAHKFINFMLEAKSAAESSNFTRYATPIVDAKPHLAADVAADQRIYPSAEVLARCTFYAPGQVERNLLINTLMTELHKLIYKKNQETADASNGQIPVASP